MGVEFVMVARWSYRIVSVLASFLTVILAVLTKRAFLRQVTTSGGRDEEICGWVFVFEAS